MAQTISTFSVNLTKEMKNRLDYLKEKYGESAGKIVSRGIDILYLSETKFTIKEDKTDTSSL